ncbi:Leucine-rich repeat receptor-like protein kinase family protein [Rhynchospora pubera]|uniref:Leucine-rich repeat receptor-like protein kinase family protein n=1 Tax=Rhynchospora pubera TaxID=906938 RepID=A0AAV8EUU2_9POAL|nr:Leucine-rich repeat receptor-like protein kinase family protein [Rhynchospora pubera]
MTLSKSPIVFLLFLSFYCPHLYCTETEIQALLAWRSSLNYPDCLNQVWSYNISNNPCQWQGIKCNEAGSITNLTITPLSMGDCSINGTLNKFNFSSFPNLTMLDIRSNANIHGEIPDDIGTLRNLQVLNLKTNNLTGAIPDTVSKLSKLTYLDLTGNHLTGSIPSALVNLSNLYYLSLSDNNLTGEISTSLENLLNLEQLDFSYNYLTVQFQGQLGISPS